MLTHGNLTWNAVNVVSDMNISSDEISLMISPNVSRRGTWYGRIADLSQGWASHP